MAPAAFYTAPGETVASTGYTTGKNVKGKQIQNIFSLCTYLISTMDHGFHSELVPNW